MSRCFPFPPPGYVRNTIADDTLFVNKEKHKEKKHRKEKKDKEKKEGKEKREKERSDEKHKEKKDKKEKHRDKKKDKEKDRDKDKHKSELLLSDEKKAVGSAENHVYKLSETSKEREIDRNASSVEKRISGVSGVHNGMPVNRNTPQVYDKNVSAEKKKDGVGTFQNKVGVNQSMEKKIERKEDGREKVRELEGQDRKGDRRKEKDRERPILKDREKEEKMKVTSLEEKHIQMTRMKGGGESMLKSIPKDTNKDISDVQSAGFHNITKDNNYHAANVNNIRKRKDPGINGICHELVIGPNKLAKRPVSHMLAENGRSLEPCQNSSAPMNIKVDPKLPHVDSIQKPPMRIKVDGKECKINGTVPEQCTKSSRETVSKAERKSADAPTKPPSHPDTKYLSEVLSVPKMDEWSNAVDQAWLFESNSSTRNPEVKLSSICETEPPQVWARGMWLEQVDVYALPYVIPH